MAAPSAAAALPRLRLLSAQLQATSVGGAPGQAAAPAEEESGRGAGARGDDQGCYKLRGGRGAAHLRPPCLPIAGHSA